MASIPSLASVDLEGLLRKDWDDEVPQLRRLNLNNTAIDDEASHYILMCEHLETLEVSGTKFTSK